ncbi:ester hydrolase C11orf54 homolog [Styela clava]
MEKGDVNRDVSVEKADLHVPPLPELADVIEKSLSENYKEYSCEVVDCPDLSEEPFRLAAPGICGNTKLVEIGGVPYLVPLNQYKEKVYDFEALKNAADLSGAFILGAGAGSKHVIGVNCEMMPNLVTSGGSLPARNLTRIAKVDQTNQEAILEHYGEKYNCTEFCLLCNTFCSAGQRGKVIKITAKCRTGKDNLVSCMRKGMDSHYDKERPVGMGGTFLTKKGKLKIHVMPDFSKTPLKSDADIENWLNFYHVRSPFVCLSTFISCDPGLDLRIEHTHGYSVENDEGGHYHTDVTPEEVEYEGYFCPAEKVYRVDKPETTHMIGRD